MMSSTADALNRKSQEDLADVEYLKKLWDEEKGSFFDALVKAETGVWTYCPPQHQVYVKTLYLDRHDKVITCTYTPLDVLSPLIKIENSTLKEIERIGKAKISCAENVAEANNNKVIVHFDYDDDDDKKTSVEITVPMPGITGRGADSLNIRSLGNRYCSSEQLYVFSVFKAGEQPRSVVRTLDELSFDVTLADLWVADREAEILTEGSYFSKNKLKEILDKDWVSSSLECLNNVAFEYKGYRKENDRDEILKAEIMTKLLNTLRISKGQKLNSAFDISVGRWSAYRDGIFGDSSGGEIKLLEIVNRLAEVDHDAKLNDRSRSHYTLKSSPLEFERAFNNRGNSSVDFWIWVEKEVEIFKSRKWGALSKHISEFIRN
ncbi:hypothetical protein [Marinobacter adhaerens]|uniref:hypothetical protein n=1 Tax=Marinobacter adhaerens TaxID=1033846 RepID=UPI003F70939C|eukprot:TRINITY_DN7_c0_g5_i1.p2 TRINITY_DN7_c0_g5~~TRINITY_DN7_c0_g5_i1.p2  ORF type:complete len:377 (-),score=-8.20 TRINITY_DN7_c0_g5_i1:76-1206(-)